MRYNGRMPYLRIDVAGPIDHDAKRALLRDTGQLFADIIGSDISRVRTIVHEIPADSFAVGGVALADTGGQAPYITLDLFEGRPPEQHRALCEQIPARVAAILDCPLADVRLRINEVFADGWSIGGVQASRRS
jgi:4-oxalocrotonate tautomerase family enzyme